MAAFGYVAVGSNPAARTGQLNEFPAIDHIYHADFGAFAANMHFESATRMSFSIVEGLYKGWRETVQTQVVPLRPGVFMLSWQEASQTSVVHIADFENSIVYAAISNPEDRTFTRLKGTLKRIK